MSPLMQALEKYKYLLGATVAFAVLYFGYSFFLADEGNNANNSSGIAAESKDIIGSEIGREIVTTLNKLNTLRIDPDFFQQSNFVRLVDYSVEIKPQRIGKRNPFVFDGISGGDESDSEINIDLDQPAAPSEDGGVLPSEVTDDEPADDQGSDEEVSDSSQTSTTTQS